MADGSRSFDVDKLLAFGDDLVECLSNDKDVNTLKQCSEQFKALQLKCNADFNHLYSSIQDYEKRIEACRQKTAETNSEAAAAAELDLLQKDLEELLQRETLLKEELRVITNEIDDREHQRVSVEERMRAVKKLEQDDKRAEMKLSMYASVTSIIPDLDNQSKISGHMVERDKKVVEKFEFDPMTSTEFDICNNIWKMINSS